MRILVATWHAQVVGGAERYLQATIPALRRAGHEVALIVERDAAEGTEPVDDRPSLASVDHGGAAAAIGAARAFAPDVVWVHGLASPALEAAVIALAPAELFAHNYYGTCGTGTKRFAVPRWEPCTRRLGAACLAITYTRRCAGLDPAQVWSTYRRQQARHALLSRYTRIMVASRHMASEMQAHVADPGRIVTLPLPLTGATPLPVPPDHSEPAGPVVLLARLTAEKGADHLLRATHAAERALGRRVPLRIVGDGPELPGLRRLAADLGVIAEFTGWMPGAERLTHLRGAALLAMPSLWPEPFGLAGIEAGALGVPAVGYALGGIPEWLRAGESGEIAPSPPSADRLGDAMVRALRDPAHHLRLARGAWQVAQEHDMERHLAVLMPALNAARSAP